MTLERPLWATYQGRSRSRATRWSDAPKSLATIGPGATCPERRTEVARISHASRSDLPKRHPEVARVSMARRHEAKPGATHWGRSRRPERLVGVTCRGRSASIVGSISILLKALLVISLCTFYISKTYVLNIFGSHQADYLLIYWEIHKNSLEKFISWILIVMFLCYCWFLIYFSTWLIWNPIWV